MERKDGTHRSCGMIQDSGLESRKEKRENKAEEIPEEIMVKNYLKARKYIKPHLCGFISSSV